MVQSAVQCPIHHSPIWPPSLFFPPLPFPCPPLSPFLPTSLYKANETEVGPLFTGGVTESKGGHKQGGRASFKVHHCLCIPERWYMYFTRTNKGCDSSSDGCNMCLCVILSFSQTSMLRNSGQFYKTAYLLATLTLNPIMLHALLFARVCCRGMTFFSCWFWQSGFKFCLLRFVFCSVGNKTVVVTRP